MPDYSDRYGGRFLNATHVIKPFVGVVDRVEDLEVEEGKKPKPGPFSKGPRTRHRAERYTLRRHGRHYRLSQHR